MPPCVARVELTQSLPCLHAPAAWVASPSQVAASRSSTWSALSSACAPRLAAREAEIRRAIHDLVRGFDGSFSAEHGIGRLKVGELARYAPPVELALMHAIKRSLDPNGIMNPGKVLNHE